MTLPYVKNDFKSGPSRFKRLRKALSADGTLVIPAYHAIKAIYVDNITANAITGGLDLGSTAGGEEVAAAKAIGANATVSYTPAQILVDLFAVTDQTLYIYAHTAWNSASIEVVVDCAVVSAADETL